MSQLSFQTPSVDEQPSPNVVDAVEEYDILDRFRFVTFDSDSEGELTHPDDDGSKLDRALVEAREWIAHHKQPKSRNSEQERQTQHDPTPTDVELDHTMRDFQPMVFFGDSGSSKYHFASTHSPSQAGPSRNDPPAFREKPRANRGTKTLTKSNMDHSTAGDQSLADLVSGLGISSAGSKSEAGIKRKSCCLGSGLGSMFSFKRLKLDGNELRADATSVRTEWLR